MPLKSRIVISTSESYYKHLQHSNIKSLKAGNTTVFDLIG